MEISRSHNLLTEALDYRAMRQDMISSNISNADTPFYRPRDVRFEDMLANKSQEIFKKELPQLEMAKTSGSHMKVHKDIDPYKATTFFRDGHMARNDGNSVDIDVETTEMAKNSSMFKALIAAYKKDVMIMKSVIEASAKT
jgi:flagellar basal-body rod protein FlgB